MSDEATKALAITITSGSSATRKNIDRLIEQNKDVKVYELNGFFKNGKRDEFKNPYSSGQEITRLEKIVETLNEDKYLNGKKLTKSQEKLLKDSMNKLSVLNKQINDWDNNHKRR